MFAPPARSLPLDRKAMIELLDDAGFYQACPGFEGLRSQATDLIAAYRASRLKPTCPRCGPDFAVVRPLVDSFFRLCVDYQKNDPDSLDLLRQYLSDKKGSLFARVSLYYRVGKDSKPARFDF